MKFFLSSCVPAGGERGRERERREGGEGEERGRRGGGEREEREKRGRREGGRTLHFHVERMAS